jgi:photosystem II stability/assembly factor-like uncharacterized protein
MRSNDNGATWELARTESSAPPVLAVKFLGNMRWIAVGGNGLVLASRDDGLTWSETHLSVSDDEIDFDPHLFDVIQLSNGNILASGEQGYVFLADAIGTSWRPIKTEYSGSIFSLVQASADHVIAFGMAGHSLVRVDSGEHWGAAEIGPQGSIFSAKRSGERLLVAGSSGMFSSAKNRGDWSNVVTQSVADFVQDPSGDYWLATATGLQRAKSGASR